MRTKAKAKLPEVVLRNGKPSAVILDIGQYQEMLEQLQDTEDLKLLEGMRKKPLKFRKLEDFLKSIIQVHYEVYIERAAERDLKKLSAEDFHSAISHAKALAGNPRPHGCRKITGSKSDWRIRFGDYHAIYDIDDNAKTIKVMRIKHRREVYR